MYQLLLVAMIVGPLSRAPGKVEIPSSPVDHPGRQIRAVSDDLADLRWDLAQAFTFDWESAQLWSKVTKGASLDTVACTLIVSVKVGFLDANLPAGLVTIDTASPTVCEVFEESGNPVSQQTSQPSSDRRYELDWDYYEGRAYLLDELQPFDVTVPLAGDSGQPLPGSISLLKGYIYALYAEDAIEVDVPFDPNAGCVEPEAAPDLMVCVDPKMPPCPGPLTYTRVTVPGLQSPVTRLATPVPLYKYTTYVKSKTGSPIVSVHDPLYRRNLLPVGDYAVVRTELIEPDRRYIHVIRVQSVRSDPHGRQGARCDGQIEASSWETYDTIRHVIAIHPIEVKIPFVLRNIPVPSVQPAGK
jgi:hypothetical protein